MEKPVRGEEVAGQALAFFWASKKLEERSDRKTLYESTALASFSLLFLGASIVGKELEIHPVWCSERMKAS